MHRERLHTGVTPDQRIGAQRFYGLSEQKGIRNYWPKHWSQMPCSLRQDLLGDGIGREIRAQPQEFSGRRILFSHACKGKGPGGGHRFGMIGHQSTTLLEQGGTVLLIEL